VLYFRKLFLDQVMAGLSKTQQALALMDSEGIGASEAARRVGIAAGTVLSAVMRMKGRNICPRRFRNQSLSPEGWLTMTRSELIDALAQRFPRLMKGDAGMAVSERRQRREK
jgi:DNA-binding CsgD family transcriptional regulator